MNRKGIDETVKRKLYAESMGRCMNPKCQRELLRENGDVIEKAHIDPYCETADNSFENLVLLCPTCHTDFDKNHAFNPQEVLEWKRIRRNELEKYFSKKYTSFEELENAVVPLLMENKILFEGFYIKENRKMWDKSEATILVNNRKLKMLLLANLELVQRHSSKDYSNLVYVKKYIAHIDEFESTRSELEKIRTNLYPPEIDSMFGIKPIEDSIFPSTEALECLIDKLLLKGKFEKVVLGIDCPYIQIVEEDRTQKVFLNDTPRLRQLYFEYGCFKGVGVRLDSLNYALKYIRSRNIDFHFLTEGNLREIMVRNKKMMFVYKYCLNQLDIIRLAPEEESVIVNLHNWNGESCISSEAYEIAETMGVQLLTMKAFYGYVNK
ncbi:MAG: HNH endonuclease signature motif containing protein [Anaerostipes sp.]|jgi:hypothetical protein